MLAPFEQALLLSNKTVEVKAFTEKHEQNGKVTYHTVPFVKTTIICHLSLHIQGYA